MYGAIVRLSWSTKPRSNNARKSVGPPSHASLRTLYLLRNASSMAARSISPDLVRCNVAFVVSAARVFFGMRFVAKMRIGEILDWKIFNRLAILPLLEMITRSGAGGFFRLI